MSHSFAQPKSHTSSYQPSARRRSAPARTGLTPRSQAVFDLNRIPITPVIQTKLTISQPGDKYEREADRVADRIMAMPEPEVQRMCTECEEEQGQKVQRQENEEETEKPMQPVEEKEEEEEETPDTEGSPQLLQRQLAGEEEEQKEDEEKVGAISGKGQQGRSLQVTPDLAAPISAMRGGGSPLPDSTRAFFEPRFGRDFGNVSIHADSRAADAADAAESINARAFTVGKDIAFGAGQYSPDSLGGRRLLAHELTHTVQQAGKDLQRDVIRRQAGQTTPQQQVIDLGTNPSNTTIKDHLRMPYGPTPANLNGWVITSSTTIETRYKKIVQFQKNQNFIMYIVQDRRTASGLHTRIWTRYVNGKFTFRTRTPFQERKGKFVTAGASYSGTEGGRSASGIRLLIAWYSPIPLANSTPGGPTHQRSHFEAYDSGSRQIIGKISNSGTFTAAVRGVTASFPDQRSDPTQPGGWYMGTLTDVMPNFYGGQKGDWGSSIVAGNANGFHVVYEGQARRWTPPSTSNW